MRRSEVDEELEFHLAMRAREYEAAGMDAAAARARAEQRFGNVAAVSRACAEVDGGTAAYGRIGAGWTGFQDDLRSALRALRRAPGYAAAVLATLAVGIAANLLIFSFLNAYFIRPLPFHEPERLLHLFHVDAERGWDQARFSLAQLEDWRRETSAFQAMAAYHYGYRNFAGQGSEPERVNVGFMTADAFDVLGVPARLGRTFSAGEEGPGAAPVVVLAHGLWQRRYGGDAGVLGRTVNIDGVSHTVIGTMPERFNFPFGGVQAWTPTPSAPTDDRSVAGHLLFGRLRPGVTPRQARADAERVFARLATAYPEADGAYDAVRVLEMRPALNFVHAMLRALLLILLGTALLVLLVAAANVAGLTLSRALSRRRELAVRMAIGAGRGRIVRQLLVEGLLLALAATALAAALARLAARALAAGMPDDLYRVGEITIDGTTLAFGALLALVTPLAFALLPALAVARRDLQDALRDGSAGSGSGRRTTRARQALVVGQVATALVLTAGAGLMLRSVDALARTDLGFDAEGVLTLQVSPPAGAYPDGAALRAYYDAALERLHALPGVAVAAAIHPLPLTHETTRSAVRVPAEPQAAAGRRFADVASVTPGYFAAMGIPVRAGRAFSAADRAGTPPVALASADLARREWPGSDPIGQRLLIGEGESAVEITVIGVVDGVRHGDLDRAPGAQLYRPVAQATRRSLHLVVRSDGDPATLAAPVRRILADLDPELPPADMRPMADLVREAGLQWGVPALVLTVLAVFAAALAGLGVFGVIGYGVTQRRREIAVRRALGARPADVRRIVVGDGMRLSLLGIVIGVVAGLALARLASRLLYGVSAGDPLVFGMAAAAFVALALLAGLLPVRRALGVEPYEALRSE